MAVEAGVWLRRQFQGRILCIDRAGGFLGLVD